MRYLKATCRAALEVSTVALLMVLLLFALSAESATLNVPANYATIQAGIDAASKYDTVLVAPGLYLENIRFKGKTIVVSSHFALEHNPEYIFSTIIDGSQPVDPDTASTVLINLQSGPETVLQGFTITGGAGTMHSWQPGDWDRMGGGVFVSSSMATIKYNYITDNFVDKESGVHAGGGGGIMLQWAVAWVENNIITNNHGNYGGGIAHGHGTSYVTNNVIAYNYGGEVYGSAGIQMFDGTITIENNTVVGNRSVLPGGGIRAFGTVQANVRNNIVWYNEAPSSAQLCDVSAVYYCNVQGGWPLGSNNINLAPHLSSDDWLYLYNDSPDIDAGDTAAAYNDLPQIAFPDAATWPSFGGLRNEIGAYGGPRAFAFHTVGIYADTTLGWNTLDVTFDVEAPYHCDGWLWDFGDGSSLAGKSVSHEYEEPGLYDVTVSLECDEFSGSVYREGLIAVLADTMKVDASVSFVEDTVEVTITAVNHIPLERLIIPIEYADECHLSLRSWTTSGCRTDGFESSTLHLDSITDECLTVVVEDVEQQLLPPGDGPVLKLKFIVSSTCGSTIDVPITLDGYAAYTPRFEGPKAAYNVPTVPGGVKAGCCGKFTGGYSGNADCSSDGRRNLADITRLIDRVYISRLTLCCEENGNVDGDAEFRVNLADITRLIDHVYLSKKETALCL